VWGEWGVSDFLGCNLILLVTKDPMQNYKIIAYLLLGYFWLVGTEKILSKVKASLATTEAANINYL
jgi:hypothetical protein